MIRPFGWGGARDLEDRQRQYCNLNLRMPFTTRYTLCSLISPRSMANSIFVVLDSLGKGEIIKPSARSAPAASGTAAIAEPRCRTSQTSYWIISSTFYTTVKQDITTIKLRSGTAVSSPNRGSRLPERTLSPRSNSKPRRAWNHEGRRFRTLQPLLRITPEA